MGALGAPVAQGCSSATKLPPITAVPCRPAALSLRHDTRAGRPAFSPLDPLARPHLTPVTRPALRISTPRPPQSTIKNTGRARLSRRAERPGGAGRPDGVHPGRPRRVQDAGGDGGDGARRQRQRQRQRQRRQRAVPGRERRRRGQRGGGRGALDLASQRRAFCRGCEPRNRRGGGRARAPRQRRVVGLDGSSPSEPPLRHQHHQNLLCPTPFSVPFTLN